LANEVLVERRGRVGLVTLNRPDVVNAINDAIRTGLPAALAELDQDDGISVIVIAGAGERGFCVGADIKESRVVGNSVQERRRLFRLDWADRVDKVTKPVIAAIHGFCMGGGLELALACDIRIAAGNALFSLPETGLGLIPGGGGTQRLPRLIGLARALDLMLTGERIGAEEALRIGLVTRIAADKAALDAEALRVAEIIAARPPAASAFLKEAARRGLDADLESGLRLEKALFSILMKTSDRDEAALAFKEKRPPKFTGA
jgi:enoyl-CoA hydratase/carnithine racemase